MLHRVLIFGILLSACGYTNKRQGVTLTDPHQRESVQRIFIPMIENRSTKAGMEPAYTSALRNILQNTKGVQVMDQESRADYLLLVSLDTYKRTKGGGVRTGDINSEVAGEISAGQNIATDIRIKLDLSARFLQKVAPDVNSPAGLRKTLWRKEFQQEATFEASNLLSELKGSSTAPNINEARESLQIQELAENFARLVVDQVLQDF